jgi:hypothetical protein
MERRQMALAQQSELSVADLRDPTRFSKLDYIRLLYKIVLQRDPDPSGLKSYSHREDTHNFLRELLSSREFKEIARNTAYFGGNLNRRRRILLFGAYGNGNIGDAIQAASLLRAIKGVRKDLEVWACSQLPSQFPFPFEYVLPPKQIYNVSLINRFDLIIIGGGGLLSHPHDPLTSEEWQRAIDVPVALFGIGAGGDAASKCSALIAKAVYASGRDEPSLAALRRYRKEVRFVPDPVLADPYYCAIANDRRKHRVTGRKKLWIIKNTSNPRTRAIINMINPDEDDVCFVEPFLDFPIVNLFPTAQPVYFVNDLIAQIDKSAVVISMRYHGCILALLRNKPAIALFEQKSRDLFVRYGLDSFFCEGDKTIPAISDFVGPNDKIAMDQKIFRSELEDVLSLLPVVGKKK